MASAAGRGHPGRLCRQEKIVKQEGKYYHAELYRRARVRTLKNRREEVQTCPAEAYAALMLSHMASSAPAEECLDRLLKRYAGTVLPVFIGRIVLPRWVNNYRGEKLDAFLAGGELFWHMEGRGGLRFDLQEEIDWDVGLRTQEKEADGDALAQEELTEKEQLIYQTLQRRGASFMPSLNGVLGSESPYDTLMSLLEKGLVYADSFVPVRQWMDQEKSGRTTAKQRVSMRVKALRSGRWDIVRPLRETDRRQSMETMLEKCFDRCLILCRETAAACGIPWQDALSAPRMGVHRAGAARIFCRRLIRRTVYQRKRLHLRHQAAGQEPAAVTERAGLGECGRPGTVLGKSTAS